VPGASGAIISTATSTVPLSGVSGTGTLAGADIWSPEAKAQMVPSGQGAHPLDRTRQTLLNPSPGAKRVPSGTLTSATRSASGRQGVGLSAGVGVWVGVGVRVGVEVGVDVYAAISTALSTS